MGGGSGLHGCGWSKTTGPGWFGSFPNAELHFQYSSYQNMYSMPNMPFTRCACFLCHFLLLSVVYYMIWNSRRTNLDLEACQFRKQIGISAQRLNEPIIKLSWGPRFVHPPSCLSLLLCISPHTLQHKILSIRTLPFIKNEIIPAIRYQ